MTIGEPGEESLDVQIASEDGRPFRCLGNVLVEPHVSLKEIEHIDAVVVCDMYTPITGMQNKYSRMVQWIQKMHANNSLISSVCSGSLILAEAGLLDQRSATTHWAYGELFSQCYPNVKIRKDDLLCLKEEKDNIVTAGGVTSWHHLAIYLVEKFCGHRLARQTAQVFLLDLHEYGQLPYAAMNRTITTEDACIAEAQSWIADNYLMANPVETMVQNSGLNHRTFARRFKKVTGRTSIDYVKSLRVEEAKILLETKQMPTDEVGAMVGYEDISYFRQVFKKKVGLSPANYRKKFQNLYPR